MNKTTRKRLLDIAAAIAMTNTDIRLAYNEEDESREINKDAAHFLKYKEKRLGRDIELYAFMGEMSSDIGMLCDFLNEVVYPLKLQNSIPAQAIQDWGYELVEADRCEEWNELFMEGDE